jgi:mono/diheme cytochrome c family protein
MKPTTIGMIIAVLCAVSTTGRSQDFDWATAQEQFDKYCAPCHGSAGDGDGDLGAALRQKPKDFTDCTDMAKSSDDDLFNAIKNGGDPLEGQRSDMPAMRKSLSDDEIRALVARVRQFCMPKGGFSIARQRDAGMAR